MCLDGLREEAMSIPFNMSASRGWKSEARINFFTSTCRETEHNTQPLWHAITKLYLGAQDLKLLASLSAESAIKETDPTVEYSRKLHLLN